MFFIKTNINLPQTYATLVDDGYSVNILTTL